MVKRISKDYLRQACEWALKKKQKCCSLSWQRIVGQLDRDNSTVDKLYRLYADCKDKSSVKILYFETSRPLSHHANPHV